MLEDDKYLAKESSLLLDSQPLDAKGIQAKQDDDGTDGDDGVDDSDGTDDAADGTDGTDG